MSRTLSSLFKQAVFAESTEEVFLLLLTIDHPSITDGPIRVANDVKNVISNGDTYIGFPFEILLPDEKEDAPPRMRLRIDNVDRQIVLAVRSIQSPPAITLDIVLASEPDTLEASFPGFTLRQTDYDALTVEGDLTLEDVLNESFPAGSFTPQVAPALF